jgi:DNA-binding NarL/FixJ family response regulator
MITVVLADDHKIMREGLRLCLGREKGVEVVGEAENGRMAVEMAARLRPDVVIMDISMPDLNGFEATRQIAENSPRTRVIALSVHMEQRHVSEMLKAGASGYLKKDCGFAELVKAVREVHQGNVYLCQDAQVILVKDHVTGGPPAEATAFSRLAPREREVLQLLAEGKNSKEIAIILGVSVKTVETYRKRMMEKLNVYTVAELTRYAIREGISPLEPGGSPAADAG